MTASKAKPRVAAPTETLPQTRVKVYQLRWVVRFAVADRPDASYSGC